MIQGSKHPSKDVKEIYDSYAIRQWEENRSLDRLIGLKCRNDQEHDHFVNASLQCVSLLCKECCEKQTQRRG